MTALYLAPLAVACPRCKASGGEQCQSTGGGNPASVPVHAARKARIASWSDELLLRAAVRVAQLRSHGRTERVMQAFADFEQMASPIASKGAAPATPGTLRLSEPQAELVEAYAVRGGVGFASTAHFHGHAARRRVVLALESKGVIEQAGEPDDYERRMRLTDFGWEVYHQNPRIIKQLSDAMVAMRADRVRAGLCVSCGATPGVTADCDDCDLVRFVQQERQRAAGDRP